MRGSDNIRVLVIGGGIAGAALARRLGRAGAEVHLIERQKAIGGRVREMGCKATTVCLRCNVCVADEILRTLSGTPGVHIHTSAQLAELQPGRNGRRYAAILADGRQFAVDAVVAAVGYEPFNPVENAAYGGGRIPNVMTGAEAERQLAGHHRIVRPSDQAAPRRIAFVQCVGSRTEEVFRRPEDTDYCSTVCCAYALRMARRIRHQSPEAEITVFYMDIQNFGKGFDEFYRECRNTLRFIRSRPYELRPGVAGSVRVKYAAERRPDGEAARPVHEEDFDLVVLAVGIRPAADAAALAANLGAPVDAQGFLGLKTASALPDMQRAGLFTVGACESPKDIAACIAQAEAVGAMILQKP